MDNLRALRVAGEDEGGCRTGCEGVIYEGCPFSDF